MNPKWLRTKAAASFGCATFVAGLGSFTVIFGWHEMDSSTVVGQLLPASIAVSIMAGLVWPGTPLTGGRSALRGLFVLLLSLPVLLNVSVIQACPSDEAAEFIGCAFGVAYFMAKIFGSLAVFTACMVGFLLSKEET